MTFKNLEDRIVERGQIDEYLDLFSKLREPTKTVLRYTLELAKLMEDSRLQNHYAVFGGYATLAYLMGTLGEKIALTWRGSEDIDVIGTQPVINALKGYYDVASDFPSQNIAHKRTLKLRTRSVPPEDEVKIDFTLTPPPYKTATKNIFGIPLQVMTPLPLIRSKLNCAYESKQRIDIMNLLYIMEQEGTDPREIVNAMCPSEFPIFKSVLIESTELVTNRRMTLAPSSDYTEDLKRAIRNKGY